MATFTITDDFNGATVTATIAGSAGGANSLFVGKAAGEVGAMPFAAAGDRVGDGAVTLAALPGLYFAYLTTDGAFQAMAYFAASSGLDAVATRCRKGVIDTIRLLPIPPAQRVYEQQWPDPSNVSFPCTLVTVDGVQETEETGISTRWDRGRPVKVMLADRQSHRDPAKLALYEFWREKVERAFVRQRVAGVPESVQCRIEPYVILDPNLPQFEYMVTGLVVRVICREPFGIGL